MHPVGRILKKMFGKQPAFWQSILNQYRAYSMRASRAFTLVELLVTIGVIAILAGLVLSVLGRAKASAQAITCRTNLRQWGMATLLYVADHNDLLPQEGDSAPTETVLYNPTYKAWYIQLPEQMNLSRYRDMPWRTNWIINPENSIWICPSNLRRCNASSKTSNLFHYCLNDHVNGTGTNNRPTRMVSIQQPSATVWLFDNGGLAAVAQQNNVHSNLHNRGAQFVFLDGHAARFKNTEYWNFKTGKGITNNPALVWIP
jgi:prepilin-type N-terminal cleavage/methylation domain-containing protein/prepilin-type processing-associated H-X9-DG protein